MLEPSWLLTQSSWGTRRHNRRLFQSGHLSGVCLLVVLLIPGISQRAISQSRTHPNVLPVPVYCCMRECRTARNVALHAGLGRRVLPSGLGAFAPRKVANTTCWGRLTHCILFKICENEKQKSSLDDQEGWAGGGGTVSLTESLHCFLSEFLDGSQSSDWKTLIASITKLPIV